MNFILLVLVGIAGGVLGGMGMGGGTALIPLLVVLFRVDQKVAQATNVISFIPMAIITLVLHYKNGLISSEKVAYIIIPALVSCVGGCLLAKVIQTKLLTKIFGAFLIVLSILQNVCNSKKKSKIICAISTKRLKEKNIQKTSKKSSKI